MKLSRRDLSMSIAALAAAAHAEASGAAAGPVVTLTDVGGLRVGHRTRDDRPTGCTVVIAPNGATAGVAVRGSAPGTRETDLLAPGASVQQVHGLVFAGGSAFGLAAADGVMQCLRDQGIGLPFGDGVIPIVPGAILFDLGIGGSSHPDANDGAAACAAAHDGPVERGSVGAGAGATVGKMLRSSLRGSSAMKGGIGSAGFRFDDGTVVAALIAVNCRGDVRDPSSGQIVAGARASDGSWLDIESTLLEPEGIGGAGASAELSGFSELATPNTTIGVVATNRTLDKTQCYRLASVAHNGLARTIVPVHTRWDGDTLFYLSTAGLPAPANDLQLDHLDVASAAAVAAATLDAVRSARGLPGIPSVSDLSVA